LCKYWTKLEFIAGNKRRRANPHPLPNSDDGTNTYDNESNEDNEGNFISPSHLVNPVDNRAELVDNMLIDSDPQSDPMKKTPSHLLVLSPSPLKIEASNNKSKKTNITTNTDDGDKSKEMELRVEICDNGSVIAKAVLDVFEECLKEIGLKSGGTKEDAIKKKWRALRVAELDVLARRMRLMIEDATSVAR
jgi:hypothetical protein